MKRNIILLSVITVSTIILLFLVNASEKRIKDINKKDRVIESKYEDFANLKAIQYGKHPTSNDMLTKNLDYGVKNDPTYFGQDVYDHVNLILQDLDIKNESRKLPQANNTKSMTGFDYIEFEIEVSCSFEKFGQFVNKLEKSNKIFVIDRFEFSNSITHGVQRAKSTGVFPDKKIKMSIWAINLERKK